MLFLKQYVLFIDLLIVSRDYTESDLVRLDNACTETYKLLITHCGGKDAVTNYFHYIGAGHVTWMCREFGNIWRYRNEGVEAYNKVLSKRANMFNSCGNPCLKRKAEVLHRKEAVTTWSEHLELHHKEHAMKVCLVGGAIKVCLVDSFIPLQLRSRTRDILAPQEAVRIVVLVAL